MKVTSLIVDYGVHFKTVLYPLTIIEVASSLEKKGYELSSSIPFPRPVGRFVGAGEIARKGKTVVQIDSGAQRLGVVDVSLESAINNFDEIATLFHEDHRVDIYSLVKFYRLNATYEIRTKKDAFESIAKNLKIPILEDFKTVLKEDLSPLSLKFAVAGLKANSEDWLDISIRPSYERNDSYVITIIYRNSDKKIFHAFLRSLEEKIVKIIKLVDR